MVEKPEDERSAVRTVMDLSYGLWRSQTLYAGVELGIFDVVSSEPRPADQIAADLQLEPKQSTRLLRALESLGLLAESAESKFKLTQAGAILQSDHPASLANIIEIINGPDFSGPWAQIPDFIRDGEPTPFVREHDQSLFERTSEDPEFAETFNDGMGTLTKVQTPEILELIDEYDFSDDTHVCDIAGGQGYFLCTLLAKYPHLNGTVLDLPGVSEAVSAELDVEDRCEFVGGDMFESVPVADTYFLKHVLHDWSDEEYVQILSTINECSHRDASVVVVEPIITGTESEEYAKLYDMYMMSTVSGRVRTMDEHTDLLATAGWEHTATWEDEDRTVSAIAVRKL